MQLGSYARSNKSAISFDPRTKLVLLITVNIIMMSGKTVGVEYVLRVVCTAVPFVLLLTIGHLKLALAYIAILGSAVFCEGLILPHVHGVLNLTLMILCGIISRFVAGYMTGWYVVRSTSVSDFITAMDRLHVPDYITIPMSVMFRYFPTLAEESRAVRDAMKMREIGQGVKNPFVYTEYVLVPVMMSTVRIADELSAASLSKGLGADVKRTHICRIHLHGGDWLLMLLSVIMLVIFFRY